MVIVVDQFEEVFTYQPKDDQARARFEDDRCRFFANLLQAAAAPGGRVAVVLTLRSDFVSSCAPFAQLRDMLSDHQMQIGPMTARELREAIEQPAFLCGCEVEPRLTERLLADVERQPGALPLLQFALTEVWKKRNVRQLTLRAYEELGGVEGALQHRADEIYRMLTARDQDLCRRLFLRLVQPGEGTGDTKRRVSFRELLPDDTARAASVRKLVHTLANRDARLITTEGTETTDGAVEVAHEALIRGWTQLRQWVDAERSNLRIRRTTDRGRARVRGGGPRTQRGLSLLGRTSRDVPGVGRRRIVTNSARLRRRFSPSARRPSGNASKMPLRMNVAGVKPQRRWPSNRGHWRKKSGGGANCRSG